MLKSLLKNLLRFGISGVCLWLALRGANLESTMAALAMVSPWAVLAGLFYVMLTAVPQVLRLRMISGSGHSWTLFLQALVLGSGLNNILPARIGEFAKMYYLKRVAGIRMSRGLEIVFWERFSDLNGLLALALFGALSSKSLLAIQLLACTVLSVWLGIGVYLRWSPFWDRLIASLPGQKLWKVALRTLSHLRERFCAAFLLRLALYALAVLVMNFGITVLVLDWIGGLGLSPAQLVTVFAISQLGLSVPSSPGSIGVYEASIVLPLVGFGVPHATALALAVVLHAIQYAPATVGCLYLIARNRLSLRELRRQELSEADEAPAG